MNKSSLFIKSDRFMRRPLGRAGQLFLLMVIATAPAVLFYDPTPLWPGERHIPREPREIYALFSDDVAYVGSSRTWDRAVANLFVPHNTHIVPVWRVLTWALTAWSGKLERIPEVLAVASYSILLAVMFLTGRLVTKETRRPQIGVAAMIMVGTTSLMLTPATWYSAGQTLWAGYGILATLWYAQSFRRSGRTSALVLAMISAMGAGWLWTVGHLAGPVAAVYLWADGRRRCRVAAGAPLAASVVAVVLSLTFGSSRIDSKISFHGRSVREAVKPTQGILHTAQAFAETLAFGNLGLAVRTTSGQGAILTVAIAGALLCRPWLSGLDSRKQIDHPGQIGGPDSRSRSMSPLEWAGMAIVFGSYLVEWSFRGYMEYRYLRTLNMHFIVPWYHAIPQIGAVLWLAGWWSETLTPLASRPTSRLTRRSGLVLLMLIVTLLMLHRPRINFLVRKSVAPMQPSEQRLWPIERLQIMRANVLLQSRSDWQRATLRRLDHAQELVKRAGLGRDALRAAFGHPTLPASLGTLLPQLEDLYDTIALLDIPEHGRPVSPMAVREELSNLFEEVKEPRPEWLAPNEVWPPPIVVGDDE